MTSGNSLQTVCKPILMYIYNQTYIPGNIYDIQISSLFINLYLMCLVYYTPINPAYVPSKSIIFFDVWK